MLRHKELAFEIFNLFELGGGRSGGCFLVNKRGCDGLRLETGLATISHKRNAGGERDVFEVGNDARTAIYRDGSGVLVATGWVAHDFDPEIGLDGLTGGSYGRPRESDAEEAAFE